MVRTISTFIISIFFCLVQKCFMKRHSLFWNPTMTPELLGKGFSKKVMMGDFLDIMCPHTGLTGTVTPNSTVTFNVYQVNEDDFNNCRITDINKIYFRCNRPDQENKLTLKMQTFSPSPFGFEFDYCTDYYYIAYPPHTSVENMKCDEKTTRFRLQLACKETTTKQTKKSTTTTTYSIKKSTIEIDSDISEDKFIRQSRKNDKNRHHHPKNVRTDEDQVLEINEDGNFSSRHQQKTMGSASSSFTVPCSLYLMLLSFLTTLFLTSSVTSIG